MLLRSPARALQASKRLHRKISLTVLTEIPHLARFDARIRSFEEPATLQADSDNASRNRCKPRFYKETSIHAKGVLGVVEPVYRMQIALIQLCLGRIGLRLPVVLPANPWWKGHQDGFGSATGL